MPLQEDETGCLGKVVPVSEYSGEFSPGDRVVVTEDTIDGSYEGEEGTVVKTYFQKGGTFAPSRNVVLALPDCDRWNYDADVDTVEGREALAALAEDENIFLMSSDDFTFEWA